MRIAFADRARIQQTEDMLRGLPLPSHLQVGSHVTPRLLHAQRGTITLRGLLRTGARLLSAFALKKAGMKRAKEKGTRVGRPPIPEDMQAEVQRLYTEGNV